MITPMIDKTFKTTLHPPYILTVFLEDTDASGFVYHPNYLKYCERARTDLLYHKGISHGNLIAQQQEMFVVYSMSCNFLASAHLHDQLCIYTDIESIHGARVNLKQSIVKDSQLLVKANITLAYVDRKSLLPKPIRVPEFIISALYS